MNYNRLVTLLPIASVDYMNSCDALSPATGCDMITWQTSNSANLAQLFKRLHTAQS